MHKSFAGLIKFCQAQLPLCIAEKVMEKIFANTVNTGRHILYAMFNTGQKFSMIKFSPMRAGGEIGENFLLAKISMY